jgi:hypothetical protein
MNFQSIFSINWIIHRGIVRSVSESHTLYEILNSSYIPQINGAQYTDSGMECTVYRSVFF